LAFPYAFLCYLKLCWQVQILFSFLEMHTWPRAVLRNKERHAAHITIDLGTQEEAKQPVLQWTHQFLCFHSMLDLK
jgi:hypothetical protein